MLKRNNVQFAGTVTFIQEGSAGDLPIVRIGMAQARPGRKGSKPNMITGVVFGPYARQVVEAVKVNQHIETEGLLNSVESVDENGKSYFTMDYVIKSVDWT